MQPLCNLLQQVNVAEICLELGPAQFVTCAYVHFISFCVVACCLGQAEDRMLDLVRLPATLHHHGFEGCWLLICLLYAVRCMLMYSQRK